MLRDCPAAEKEGTGILPKNEMLAGENRASPLITGCPPIVKFLPSKPTFILAGRLGKGKQQDRGGSGSGNLY